MLIIQYKFQYQNYMYPVQKRASGHIFFCERNNTTETEYVFCLQFYFNGVDRNRIHLLAYSFILMGLTETEYIFWPTVLFHKNCYFILIWGLKGTQLSKFLKACLSLKILKWEKCPECNRSSILLYPTYYYPAIYCVKKHGVYTCF